MTPLVYSGFVYTNEHGKSLQLQVIADADTVETLTRSKIGLEPGNDDVINFYAGFYPAVHFMATNVVSFPSNPKFRYDIGRTLGRHRFQLIDDNVHLYTVDYQHHTAYNASEPGMEAYRNIWEDGILPFVTSHVPEFCVYLSIVKTLQLRSVTSMGEIIESNGIGTTYLDKRDDAMDIMSQMFTRPSPISVAGIISDLPVTVTIGKPTSVEERSIPRDLLEAMRNTTAAMTNYRTLVMKRQETAIERMKREATAAKQLSFQSNIRIAMQVVHEGWESDDRGFVYKHRIDAEYIMTRHGERFSLPQGVFWVEEIWVPYNSYIARVYARAHHPHVASDGRVCTGTLPLDDITNITRIPELLKGVMEGSHFQFGDTVAEYLARARNSGSIVGQQKDIGGGVSINFDKNDASQNQSGSGILDRLRIT